eukprot:c20271_g1_i1.p1 GENE.c20271_g1_i1~~c20271_g1_i1.p1  ORF type:complete len:370 (+),score=59.06 c20271_g1_i1:84-1193(+)
MSRSILIAPSEPRFFCLNNDSTEFPFHVAGVEFTSVTQYYQAMKFQQDSKTFKEIVNARTPAQACKIASQHKDTLKATASRSSNRHQLSAMNDFRMSKDKWTGARGKVMMAGLLAKITQNDRLRQTLDETEKRCLIHCCSHPRWGSGDDGLGLNWIGHALSALRDYLHRNVKYVWNGRDPGPHLPQLPKLRPGSSRRRSRVDPLRVGKNFKTPGQPNSGNSGNCEQDNNPEGEGPGKINEGLAEGFLICSDCRTRTATRIDRSDGLFYCFPCWEDFYGVQQDMSHVDRILSYYPSEHFEVLELEWMLEDEATLSSDAAFLTTQARSSFKRLSLLVHPDKNRSPFASEAFSRLSTALEHVTRQIQEGKDR